MSKRKSAPPVSDFSLPIGWSVEGEEETRSLSPSSLSLRRRLGETTKSSELNKSSSTSALLSPTTTFDDTPSSLASVNLSIYPDLVAYSPNSTFSSRICPDVPVLDLNSFDEKCYGWKRHYEEQQSEDEEDDAEERCEKSSYFESYLEQYKANVCYFREKPQVLLICILFVLAAVFFSFSSSGFYGKEATLKTLRTDVSQFFVAQKYSSGRVCPVEIRRLKKTILFVMESLVNGTEKLPLIMLFAGPSNASDAIVDWLAAELLPRYWKGHQKTDIHLSPTVSRRSIEGEIVTNTPSVNDRRFLVLRGLDTLREPLFLHSIADPVSSLFPNSLILMTMEIDENESKSAKENGANRSVSWMFGRRQKKELKAAEARKSAKTKYIQFSRGSLLSPCALTAIINIILYLHATGE